MSFQVRSPWHAAAARSCADRSLEAVVIQNLEFYNTDRYSYLLIHKNACSFMTSTIQANDRCAVACRPADGVRFAVVRDPWDRFVSGVQEDVKRFGWNLNAEWVASMNWSAYLVGLIDTERRRTGHISHVTLQTTYLYGADIDWHVDIADLDRFVAQHFESSGPLSNPGDALLKSQLVELLRRDGEALAVIEALLDVDRFTLDRIRQSDSMWRPPVGPVF